MIITFIPWLIHDMSEQNAVPLGCALGTRALHSDITLIHMACVLIPAEGLSKSVEIAFAPPPSMLTRVFHYTGTQILVSQNREACMGDEIFSL